MRPRFLLCLPFLLLACTPQSVDSSDPGGDSDKIGADSSQDSPADSSPDSDSWQDSEAPAPREPYLIVAAPDLLEAAQAWGAWREETGFAVQVLATTDLVSDPLDTAALVQAVRERLTEQRMEGLAQYLLLIGDASHSPELGWAIGATPCDNDLDGCDTDNPYADLNGDGVPELAVGRIPARSAEAVSAALARSQAQEQPDIGEYNRKFVFWAGPTGFDEDLTRLVEGLVMKGLATVDPAYEIVGVYGEPSSAYYDPNFEERVLSLLNTGGGISVYLGHGSSSKSVGLSPTSLPSLDTGTRQPFMALFACSNGEYLGDSPSLAEQLLALDTGPAAVLAGSGETHPYANAVFPYEMQRAALGEATRVGEALLTMKTRAMAPDEGDSLRGVMDLSAIAEYDYSAEDLTRLLLQHQNLYNLFGDPALLLQRPTQRLSLDLHGHVDDGAVQVSGEAGGLGDGLARVTLEVPRDVLLDEGSWEQAINTVIAEVTVEMTDGHFSAELSFDPEPLPGKLFYVKAYAWTDSADAFAAEEAP